MVNGSIVLESERLLLCLLTPQDLNPLMAVLSDVNTMIHYPRPWDRATVERWINRALRSYEELGYGIYAVVLRETGEVLGDCGFVVQQVDEREETELGWHIGRSNWNRGYATEAARACRDFGFGALGLTRFISLIRPVNLQSRRVAEKIGMTIERETEFRGLLHYVYSLARKPV
jgi:ribosomal-protein-alanine N-acetyltransferase